MHAGTIQRVRPCGRSIRATIWTRVDAHPNNMVWKKSSRRGEGKDKVG